MSKQSKTIPFQTLQEAIETHPMQNDDMEIVVVSDTVRQRRSRTPSTSATPVASISNDTKEHKTNDSNGNVMPDLLPKTFHLVESSALFSQIHENCDDLLMQCIDEADREQRFAVVEIRESSIALPKRAIGKAGPNISENIIEESNTCSILESVNFMQPSNVETVNIVDLTSEPSDTETCSTPNPDDRSVSAESSNESDSEHEYDTGEAFRPSGLFLNVSNRQIRSSKTNDFEYKTPAQLHSIKPVSILKKTLAIDRNSFHDADRDDEEPLIFSDDDEQCVDEVQADELISRQTVHAKNLPTKANLCHNCVFRVCCMLWMYV